MPDRPSRSPRLLETLLAASFATLLVIGVSAGCSHDGPGDRPAAQASASTTHSVLAPEEVTDPAGSARMRAVRVLHAWDAAREEALTEGDVRAVRALYAPGTQLAAQDLTLLRSYQRRGVRLTDLEQQTLAVDVRVAAGRLVELAVTGRLAVAQVAIGSGRQALPASAVVRRVLRFERDRDGAWRLSSATAG